VEIHASRLGRNPRLETVVSAITPGTEMLVYRGQVSADMPLDSSIFALAEAFPFPLKYGYAAVGRITTLAWTSAESG
jgi:hypothetical protein